MQVTGISPASCTTSPDCARPCVAGWSSRWWWTLSPNKFSPSASVWDQIGDSKIKDAGEAPEVVIPFVFVHSYFYVTQYFQSETCRASRGRAAPRCCRILSGPSGPETGWRWSPQRDGCKQPDLTFLLPASFSISFLFLLLLPSRGSNWISICHCR